VSAAAEDAPKICFFFIFSKQMFLTDVAF